MRNHATWALATVLLMIVTGTTTAGATSPDMGYHVRTWCALPDVEHDTEVSANDERPACSGVQKQKYRIGDGFRDGIENYEQQVTNLTEDAVDELIPDAGEEPSADGTCEKKGWGPQSCELVATCRDTFFDCKIKIFGRVNAQFHTVVEGGGTHAVEDRGSCNGVKSCFFTIDIEVPAGESHTVYCSGRQVGLDHGTTTIECH